jgi:hypothetical protein
MTITKTAGATAPALAVMLGAAATAFGQNAEEMPSGMGPGMGHGYGPGPGMMGQGMVPGIGQGFGPGMTGQELHPFRRGATMELSTDDVRRFLERHISAHGLMHLQVGDVTQTDEDTITADVVTREGSLALRLEIDAYTGFVESVS